MYGLWFRSLVYLSLFMPVSHCFNYCSFVVGLKIGKCGSSKFVFLQDCFGSLESLEISHKFLGCVFLYLQKQISWVSDTRQRSLILQSALGNIVISVSSTSVHELGISSHLFQSLISFTSVLQFSVYLASFWLNFFLSILIFHDAILNGIIFLTYFSDCRMLVYRNTTDFSALILYSATLLNLFTSSSSFGFFGIFVRVFFI